MTKQEKVQDIARILNHLYPNPPIPLDHQDTYTLLIAVLLSAQCTDERVNKVTPHLFAQADNPFDMIKLGIDDIKAIIRPCGLSPQKSKAIHTLSHILVDRYQGDVPQSLEQLEELPGVGHKTASCTYKPGRRFADPLRPFRKESDASWLRSGRSRR